MGFENGKVVEVVLKATAGGDSQVNTFTYDLDDGGSIGSNDPQTLADVFRDDVRDLWGSLYASSWTVEPVQVTEVKDPQDPTAPRSSWTSGTAQAGTGSGSGDVLPPNCQVLVALTTAHIGRRFRGRLWLGGTTHEADQATGSWVSGYLTGIQTILDAIPHEPDLILGPADGSAKWSVYSRTQRAANLDPYLSPITGVTKRTLVHMLRSRALYG